MRACAFLSAFFSTLRWYLPWSFFFSSRLTTLGETYVGSSYSVGPPKAPAKILIGCRHSRGPV